MKEAYEYTLCGMYLELDPNEYNSLDKARHVQEEMRDNWEVELSYAQALDILMEYGVLVPPTEWEEDEDEDDEICFGCHLKVLAKHIMDLDERLTQLEEEK